MNKNEGAGLIYDMYNATQNSASTSGDAHLTEMQRMLVLLENDIKVAPEVQIGSSFQNKERNWMATAELKYFRKSFLHYRVKDCAATHRIYINCKPEVRGEVFKGILSDHRMFRVPGLANAKLSTPDDGGRTDTIVIYTEGAAANEAALDCIEAYHRTAKRHFSGILPKLVTPARGLKGVGTAMEPPSLRLVSTGGKFYKQSVAQSFGAYRSELIFMALERTRLSVPPQTKEQRKQAFKRRVEKYFRRAGIDPDNPALQGDVAKLPSLSTIKDWTNKNDSGD